MSDQRMGGMKLGNFSGIKKTYAERDAPPGANPLGYPLGQAEPTKPPELESEVKPTETEPVKTAKPKAKVGKKTQKKEQLVTVNIKIRKNQKEWLADTASTVRDNNTEPVPPSERVYPQHLIGVAIDFLEAAGVDWGEVRNVNELREYLNL